MARFFTAKLLTFALVNKSSWKRVFNLLKLWYTFIVIKMNNRKGFTLIELLVTVALIGSMSIVVGVSVTSLLNNQKQKRYDEFVEQMEDAGCVFAQNDNRTEAICEAFPTSCQIKLGDLIDYGLIKRTIQNPMTKKDVSEDNKSYVLVTYKDGEKFCKFQDLTCEDKYCKDKNNESK